MQLECNVLTHRDCRGVKFDDLPDWTKEECQLAIRRANAKHGKDFKLIDTTCIDAPEHMRKQAPFLITYTIEG